MKKLQLYSAIVFAALVLFSGCSDKTESSVPLLSDGTATTAVTDTTETTRTTESAVTTTIMTTSASTTEVATETTSESVTFTHRYEIMNTAFRTRSVNERCLKIYERNPEYLPENVLKAIEEGREVYGTVKKWCVDEENNCIYALVGYGLKRSFAKDLAVYRIDMKTGETVWCCDTAEPDDDVTGPVAPDSGFQDVFGFMKVGGKLIYEPFSGLYYVDEESHSLVAIETMCNVQSDIIALSDNKIFIHFINYQEDGKSIDVNEVYDPQTDTMSQTDAFPGFDKNSFINNVMNEWYLRSDLICEGEKSGEHKIIFEWD